MVKTSMFQRQTAIINQPWEISPISSEKSPYLYDIYSPPQEMMELQKWIYVRKSAWTSWNRSPEIINQQPSNRSKSWNLPPEIINISTNHHFSLIPSYIPKNIYDVNYVNHQISLKSSRNQKNRQVEDLMSLDFDVLTQTEDFLEELVPRPCRISVVISGRMSMGENMWTDMKKPWFPSEKTWRCGHKWWVFHICVSLEDGHLRLFMVSFGEELSPINIREPPKTVSWYLTSKNIGTTWKNLQITHWQTNITMQRSTIL
jgi:hypothetical protein